MAENTTEKIRVLALCDYCCGTGFATVSSNIMRELRDMDKFDVDIVAINATGDPYDTERFPFRVYPAVTIETLSHNPTMDVYGMAKFAKMLKTQAYDVVFIIQDTFIVQSLFQQYSIPKMLDEMERRPKIIFYYPIDATPDPAWITDAVALTDYPVPYTNYAKVETLAADKDLKDKLREPIYHGTNIDEFFFIEDRDMVAKFRHEWFDRGMADKRFTIMNLNRNQPRKDIFRSLQVLKRLRELGDDETLLYLHMQFKDTAGNIVNQADQLGLELGKDFVVPHPRVFNNPNRGIDVPTLNILYNAVDAVMTTTHGEGWGLSVTEGFATRTPVIAPHNTSLIEMMDDNRGITVPSGEVDEAWIVRENDNDRIRPIVNVNKMAKAILELRAMKNVPDLDKAYDWARKYSWKNICKEWGALFIEAGEKSKAETAQRKRAADIKAKAGNHGKKPIDRKKLKAQRKKGRR